MAQKKIVIPADAICVRCNQPKRAHSICVNIVGPMGCDRFRQTDDYVSVMDSCRIIINYDPYRPVTDEESN